MQSGAVSEMQYQITAQGRAHISKPHSDLVALQAGWEIVPTSPSIVVRRISSTLQYKKQIFFPQQTRPISKTCNFFLQPK
jgi:hypothetical protein